MKRNLFQELSPNIGENRRLRIPQRECFAQLEGFARGVSEEREVGIVLPVGCGKSGCIALAPFAFGAVRALVVAPGIRIAKQLYDDFDPTQPGMFYAKTAILPGPPFPEPVEIRGTTTNPADLDEADVVVTNIQQLQGDQNRWLEGLPTDCFDLILFDEGHHSVAATWEELKRRFPAATVVNFSATPLRADGQRMAGRVLYSFPVFRAIQEGYIKQIKALVLNPSTLRYVRREGDNEIEVTLDEVRRLGEQDADFRRSIVTSRETLSTIVDASIRELDRLRAESRDSRLKIIASALNYEHCLQVVAAYRERGRRADFVHSREDSAANDRVVESLENHELDVVVQVRKLGEGFDHPYLSVAAVFSVFANLSPFVQFVGRIMRAVRPNEPGHVLNRGTVVFHAGANVAARWEDFQDFSEADQEYFQELLPLEGLDFSDARELEVLPDLERFRSELEVRGQSGILLEEIPLIEQDSEAMRAISTLQLRGYTPEQVRRAMELRPVPTTRVYERQAARARLNDRVRVEVGRILGSRGLNSQGHELDRNRLGRTNFQVLKAALDRLINQLVGRPAGSRHEFTRKELDLISERFDQLALSAAQEVLGG